MTFDIDDIDVRKFIIIEGLSFSDHYPCCDVLVENLDADLARKPKFLVIAESSNTRRTKSKCITIISRFLKWSDTLTNFALIWSFMSFNKSRRIIESAHFPSISRGRDEQ